MTTGRCQRLPGIRFILINIFHPFIKILSKSRNVAGTINKLWSTSGSYGSIKKEKKHEEKH